MTGHPIDVGGTQYTVRYNPNLSAPTRGAIHEHVSKSASADSTDIYDMDTVLEALNDGRLSVSDNDKAVLNAIEEGYIEIS